MEIPNTKYYTPRKDRGFYAYRFNVKMLPAGVDKTCSLEIVGNVATVLPGSTHTLIREAGGRLVYFRVASGILPTGKYRADQYMNRLELVWG